MELAVILGFVFIAISSITLIVLWLLRSRAADPTVERFKELEQALYKSETARAAPKDKKEKLKIKETVEQLLSSLGKVSKSDEEKLSKQKTALMQAGFQHENSLKVFMFIPPNKLT